MFVPNILFFAILSLLWPTTFEQVSKCPTFCGLTGLIPDSNCKIFEIDKFNQDVFEKLNSLLSRTYFRYFKTVLYKKCKFWVDDAQCMGYGCVVKPCNVDELPESVRQWNHSDYRYVHSECQSNDPLGNLDTKITESNETFKKWENFDSSNLFCNIVNDENHDESVYVDLQRNPERFTGYRGESAWKIWDAIYKEVSFSKDLTPSYGSSLHRSNDMCLENRIFYNIISGLHSSINVHLCANFFFPGNVLTEHWGYNLIEFNRRFGANSTKGAGPKYLKNLYFLYLLELRALIKAAPLLKNMIYYSGSESENLETKKLVNELLALLKSLPCSFNESVMFIGDPLEVYNLKKLFSSKFVNITYIMDCVGCDKCRMWGRLQTTALAAALNILFSTDSSNNKTAIPAGFRLTRTDIVALFNSFGRTSSSIRHINRFRQLAHEDYRTEL